MDKDFAGMLFFAAIVGIALAAYWLIDPAISQIR